MRNAEKGPRTLDEGSEFQDRGPEMNVLQMN